MMQFKECWSPSSFGHSRYKPVLVTAQFVAGLFSWKAARCFCANKSRLFGSKERGLEEDEKWEVNWIKSSLWRETEALPTVTNKFQEPMTWYSLHWSSSWQPLEEASSPFAPNQAVIPFLSHSPSTSLATKHLVFTCLSDRNYPNQFSSLFTRSPHSTDSYQSQPVKGSRTVWPGEGCEKQDGPVWQQKSLDWLGLWGNPTLIVHWHLELAGVNGLPTAYTIRLQGEMFFWNRPEKQPRI